MQVGLIIGRGGETIKSLQTKSGARIQVVVIVYLEPFYFYTKHVWFRQDLNWKRIKLLILVFILKLKNLIIMTI